MLLFSPGGAAVFALIGGILNDRIGRKLVIIIASLIFMAGSLVLAFASDKFMLLSGRIVVGAGIGKCTLNINLFSAERFPGNSPPKRTGSLI